MLALLMIACVTTGTHADEFAVTVTFNQSDLGMNQQKDFVDVTLPGCELLTQVGAPALPVFAEQIVLPDGVTAIGANVISLSSVRIPCGMIRPAQKPAIIGFPGADLPEPKISLPDPKVYEGKEVYPKSLGIFRGTGRMGDLNIASCEIRPVQYDPSTQEIILHTELSIELTLAPDPDTPVNTKRRSSFSELSRKMANKKMRNFQDLSSPWSPGYARNLDPANYEYVIVTVTAQESAYQTYADWKTAKGVPATVVTTTWIDANYSGRDIQEKIRNFIIDAKDTWGISYVLIGGDDHIVPSRVAWAFECEAGFDPDEDNIRADLYYSDLDGTWDENGNSIFGEIADNVDLYPDVMVGRAPTDDLSDANAVVNKFMTYEKNPPADYATEAFFFAEVLWSNPYTDSGILKDMIDDLHFDSRYEPIEKQYESMMNETPTSVLNYLNTGPHLTNHAGHAWYSSMGCGTGYIYRGDVDALTNGPNYFVLYSIGCWSAAFDYNCMAEHFATNPNGGTIAYVGNSRYGWGSPGHPGWGYSETFDADFYGAILSEGLTQFGAAVAWPKILRIPYSQDENVYRCHLYQVNLLGDPEMACHTEDITALQLDAPTPIPDSVSTFTATVTDANGPVEGARLCLSGTGVYMVGSTDASGQVVFDLSIDGPLLLTLTATAPSHIYTEQHITVQGGNTLLAVESLSIDDDSIPPSNGTGDGEIGAGETVELSVTVHNFGDADCHGVAGTVSSSDPRVTITDSLASFGTLTAGNDAVCSDPFVLSLDPGCAPGDVVMLSLELEDDSSNVWTEPLPIRVLAPSPMLHHYYAVELTGDGDGVPEPGETISVTARITNDGIGSLDFMSATLTTSDPNFTVLSGSASADSVVMPDGMTALSPPYQVEIDPSCPDTSFGVFLLTYSHDEGSEIDTLYLAVGEPGFADDVETGEGGWSHYGTGDMWHVSSYRCHSGSDSWYCGDPGTHLYGNNMDSRLVSPYFVTPTDPVLSFWSYFDVTIYGVDGMHIDYWVDGDWETLDYIGSGGALDPTLFVCGWAEHSHELEKLEPGDLSRVRFRVVTDGSDRDEGFFVDDISIRSTTPTQVETGDTRVAGTALQLSPAWPNPARSATAWCLSLPRSGDVDAKIFDVRGRLVKDLKPGRIDAGDHLLEWDGRGVSGESASSGIYFLKIHANGAGAVRKVVKLGR
jgi:hypothetical protein